MFEGTIGEGECVRIMTGACLPADADAVVKYEIVGVVEGDGKPGSVVSFSAPTKVGSNIRAAGEEAHAGDVVVEAGDVLTAAGVGFLAGCGVLEVPVYRRPRVAVIATGSELVPPSEVPGPGKIRNSNSYALAACVQAAGGVPTILPIVEDTLEALAAAVSAAACEYLLPPAPGRPAPRPICSHRPDTFEALRDAVAQVAREYDSSSLRGGAANGDSDFTGASGGRARRASDDHG